MSEERTGQPLSDGDSSPTHPPAIVDPIVETGRVRRRGGYLVWSVGWSGFAHRVISVLYGFLIAGLAWAGLILVGALVDESFLAGFAAVCRIVAPETPSPVVEDRRFPLLEGESRKDLQTRWKQLLAEVQLEQSTYPPRFVRILRDLTPADLARIDRIAPYVVGDALLRNSADDSGHDIPALRFMDFARLKTIGVLEQGQLGQKVTAKPRNGQPATHLLQGSTLALIVTASDPDADLEISISALSEEGRLIVDLLDRPNSLSGLCTSAARLQEAEMNVQIGARFEPDEGAWANPKSIPNVTALCRLSTG